MREKKENEPICIGCGSDERKYQAPAGALEPNTILHGRYLAGAVCSRGPSGLCYAALDLITERRVDMYEWTDMGSGTAEDFVREEGFQAKKNGLQGIAQVYDTFTEQGKLFAAVEHLPDEVLRDHLAFTSGAFTWNEAVRLLMPVMESVRYLNAQGCVYGDISPETVRIRRDNSRKISARLVPFTGFDDRAPGGASQGTKRPQDDVSGIAVCLTKCVMGLGFSKDPSKKSARKSSGLTQSQGDTLQKGLISAAGDGYASMGDFLEDIQKNTEGSEFNRILGGRRQKKSHKGLVFFLLFLLCAGGGGAWAWQNGYLEKPIEVIKGYANYGIAWLNGLRSERVPVPAQTEEEPGSESAASGTAARIPDFASDDEAEDEDLTEAWAWNRMEEETEGMTGESAATLARDAFDAEDLSEAYLNEADLNEADAENAADAFSANEEALTEEEPDVPGQDSQNLIQDEEGDDAQNPGVADTAEPAQNQGADEENAAGMNAENPADADTRDAESQIEADADAAGQNAQDQTGADADQRPEAETEPAAAAEDPELAAASGSIDRAEQYKDLPWVKNVPEFNEIARSEILGTTIREPYSGEEQKTAFKHRHTAVSSVSGMNTFAACDEAAGQYHLFAIYEQHIYGISQALPVCEDLSSYSWDEFSALASEGEQISYAQFQEALENNKAQADSALAQSDALKAYVGYLNGEAPASYATPAVNSLNVRSAPQTGEVLGQINKEERVAVITPVEDGWVMIDHQGQPAYVAGSYVSME